jgi:hypothetical protein
MKTQRAARALSWGFLSFLAAQLACAVILEWKKPEFYDPKYGCRLNKLRAALSASSGSRLLVILGSSRSEQGFRPSLLTGAARTHKHDLLYNFARGGSSPLLHLLTLKRLLADGITPDGLFLEVFPPALADDETEATLAKTTLRDFALLAGHPLTWQTYANYARDRVLFWSSYRTGLLASLAPACVCRGKRWETLWNAQSGEWSMIGEAISAEDARMETADARRRYQKKLRDLTIAPQADRATRELLELCRESHIEVLLFLMPEASEFRNWYTAAGRKRLDDYLAEICSHYRTPMVDARTWVADEDFWDGHHLLLHGAATFMRRFDAEVLRPSAGTGSSPDLVIRPSDSVPRSPQVDVRSFPSPTWLTFGSFPPPVSGSRSAGQVSLNCAQAADSEGRRDNRP